ncbi:hypothetical protein [Ochrobactrum sp. EDr1-4]|uniref:hypothetical protein n=1 Tax=Ochrobactrum sp. EDr1-4 TaxID=3368622 RepID=UPI003B9E1AEC
MTAWTEDDLQKLDVKYANEGVHLHQRPFRAAMELLGSAFALGVGGNPEVQKITAAYEAIFPETNASWPGAGIGLAASVDRVRKVTLPVVFGTCAIETWQATGFKSAEEWWDWCRKDHDIGSQSSFALADLHDFAYGLNEVQQGCTEALTLWRCQSERNIGSDAISMMVFSYSHRLILPQAGRVYRGHTFVVSQALVC